MISGGLTPAKVQGMKELLCQAKQENSEWKDKCESAIDKRSSENLTNDLDEAAYQAVGKRCDVDQWNTKRVITAKCAYFIMAEEPDGRKYQHGNVNQPDYSSALDYTQAATDLTMESPEGKSFGDFVMAAKEKGNTPDTSASVKEFTEALDAGLGTSPPAVEPDAAGADAPATTGAAATAEPATPPAESEAPAPEPEAPAAEAAPDADAAASELAIDPYAVAPAVAAGADAPAAELPAPADLVAPAAAPSAPAALAPAADAAVATETAKTDKSSGNFAMTILPTTEGSDSPAFAAASADISIPIDVGSGDAMTLNGGFSYEKKPFIGHSYNETFALINALDAGKRALNGTLYLSYSWVLDEDAKSKKVVGTVEAGQIHRSAIETTGAGIKGGVAWTYSETLQIGVALYLGSAASYEDLLNDKARGFKTGGTTASINLNATYQPFLTDGELFKNLTFNGLVAKDMAGEDPSDDPGVTFALLTIENPLPVGTEITLTPSVTLTKLQIDDMANTSTVSGKLTGKMGQLSLEGALTYRNGSKMDQTISVDTGNSLDEPATGSAPVTGPLDYTTGGDQKEYLLRAVYQMSKSVTLFAGLHWWENQEEQAVTFPGGSDEFENTAGTRGGVFGGVKGKF